MTLAESGARVSESFEQVAADARVGGSAADWVATLTPAGTRRVTVSGRTELAEFALGLLTLGRPAVDIADLDAARSVSL